jgi:small subunit ribosomal protein S16
MSTRIRLRRMGANKRPFYRVVVADQRSPRDGRFIENIGKYHPLEDPSLIEIDEERALHWLRVGAQPSEQVLNLLAKVGIWETFVAERPKAAEMAKAARPEKPPTAKRSKKAKALGDAEPSSAATAMVGDAEPSSSAAATTVGDSEPSSDAAATMASGRDSATAAESSSVSEPPPSEGAAESSGPEPPPEDEESTEA